MMAIRSDTMFHFPFYYNELYQKSGYLHLFHLGTFLTDRLNVICTHHDIIREKSVM